MVWCLFRNTPASKDQMNSVTFQGLLNFTNSQQQAGAASGNCLLNSDIYNENSPMQEVRCIVPFPSPLMLCCQARLAHVLPP